MSANVPFITSKTVTSKMSLSNNIQTIVHTYVIQYFLKLEELGEWA